MHDDYHTTTVLNLIFYGRNMLAISTLLHMDYLCVDVVVRHGMAMSAS